MNEPAHLINGAFLRHRRESKGWAQTDLATRACLSLKQVRQIEDGGNSAFYSDSVKATAARKLATLLGLPPEQAFVAPQSDVAPLAEQHATDLNPPWSSDATPGSESAPAAPAEPDRASAGHSGADLSSVMTHVAVATADIDPPPPQSLSADGGDGESRSSSFVWIALLAVAVGAGVLLMPKTPDAPIAPAVTAPIDPNPPAPAPMDLPADAVDASGNQPVTTQLPALGAPVGAAVTSPAPAPMGQAAGTSAMPPVQGNALPKAP